MGVKSLWDLLTPVGRPVLLETMEGKTMAIDSSIWIYQFQATMRDKEGRGLVNAHVLGFLRRICKLMFYGIRPVFVFDGGAPGLKRSTLAERKKKKQGAAESHARLAEKLLAAQLRRKALDHARPQQHDPKGKGKEPARVIDGDTVYLEDIDGSLPRTPVNVAGKGKSTEPGSGSKKKSRFHDHDPYKLPEVDLQDVVANATRSAAPDPRLATEEELRTFIEDMRPEDFDVTSPAFRELPTEVQYEIIGDLRLKSRQTSYDRLQNMLRKARTPLDFSKEQIKNLKQRNSLTQQLLTTTDSIGHAHIAIPVRIASERNKEYILVKNEGESGGWILGIRDDGTQAKPIEIDQDVEAQGTDDSDMEMEEVDIVPTPGFDPDLREYRQGMALSAIAKRHSPEKRPRTARSRPSTKRPLFQPDDEEQGGFQSDDNSYEDPELSLALQESIDQMENAEIQHAIEASKLQQQAQAPSRYSKEQSRPSTSAAGSAETETLSPSRSPTLKITNANTKLGDTASEARRSIDDLYGSPSRLETALSIGNVRPSLTSLGQSRNDEYSRTHALFGRPDLLLSAKIRAMSTEMTPSATSDYDDNEDQPASVTSDPSFTNAFASQSKPDTRPVPGDTLSNAFVHSDMEDSDEDMEEVITVQNLPETPKKSTGNPGLPSAKPASTIVHINELNSRDDEVEETSSSLPAATPPIDHMLDPRRSAPSSPPNPPAPSSNVDQSNLHILSHDDIDDSQDDHLTNWSRSPSPMAGELPQSGPSSASKSKDENWDAAQEMDPNAEEGEFARFISQVKGRNLEDVREEIDAEIKALNQQKKVAMRDSEDITHQMIAQIMTMLRLFGIPYITAPMEAEAQCAELVQLGLVEGIITDDSDVFLFGGLRVFKNMFNQSKTVECFLLSDLARELGLERDKLIRLAYLLGSDYVDGLSRVGPVVAMELLSEFPGEDGLHKFKDWWSKVQSGRDSETDNKSSFRKRFKKKFKDLYLPPDWPNPAVRDAYYHPTVDDSEEPFKWGLPDLDALRGFFHEELGWGQNKVDDLLLPIIQRVGKRRETAALNKQGNLDEFFDVSGGNGAYAPRKRQAYASKRLQQVVSNFRNQRARSADGDSVSISPGPHADTSNPKDNEEEPPKKRRKSGATAAKKGKGQTKGSESTRKASGSAARSRGGKTAASSSRRKKIPVNAGPVNDEDAFADDIGANAKEDSSPPPPLSVNLRPRPKAAYRGTALTRSPTEG